MGLSRNPFVILTIQGPDFVWDPSQGARPTPRSHGFGLPVHIQRQQMLIASEVSPGGGGPGQSLTSTDPPLSLEATGASLAQPGKTEGPARVSKRGSRTRRCTARFRGDHGEYPVPVRCQKNAGHRWKHRAGKFTW